MIDKRQLYHMFLVIFLSIVSSDVYAQEQTGKNYKTSWSIDTCLHMVNMDPYGARDYALQWQGKAESWQTHYCHAYALRQEGEDENAAKEFYQIAQIIEPQSNAELRDVKVKSYQESAEIWYLLGRKSEALKSVREGLQTEFQNVDLQAIFIRILLDNHENQQAYNALHSCQKEHISSNVLMTLLAETQLRLGDKQNALKTVDSVISKDQDNMQAFLLRGEIWQELGHYQNAKNDWKFIVDSAPGSHEADMASQNLIIMDSNPDVP